VTTNTQRPTVLVIGSTGQLGWELTRRLSTVANVISTQRDSSAADQYVLDLADERAISACVKSIRPAAVINAAAYTQVDKAQTEPRLAELINAAAPAALARVCAGCDSLLVHYSTDYVFDGNATAPYQEDHATFPGNVYGQTKLAGEVGVRENHAYHFIFRTSWIYAARGKNFVRTIFEKAHTSTSLRVVDDQYGCPTSAAALAEGTKQLFARISSEGRDWAQARAGTYHLAAAGACTWHELASQVVVDIEPKVVVSPIASSEYPTPAPRPSYSVLDCAKAESRLGLRMPHWREQLQPVLEALRARQ
jgi:dTDP-4-dehydrorhamnose reductase